MAAISVEVTCKPSTSSPVPAADCSPTSSSATSQSEQLNLIHTAAESCANAPPMDGSQGCACTKETFGCSIHPNTRDEWIACMRASLARILASPEVVQELALKRAVASTAKSCALLAWFDPVTCSLKTSQQSWLADSMSSSPTLPRSGMTRNGCVYGLPTVGRRTGETDGGCWPTPNLPNGGRSCAHVTDWRGRTAYHNGKKVQVGLEHAVKFWPTPKANDAEKRWNFAATNPRNGLPAAVKLWPTPTSTLGTKGGRVTPRKSREGGTLIEAVSARAFPTPSSNDWKGSSKPGQRRGQITDPDMGVIPAGGKLNPMWVEWLQAWPLGWTGLKPSATGKCPSKPRSPGESSEGHRKW